MQMMSNLNVSCRLFDTVFRNVWLRKTYHLLVGSVLIATVVILDRAWFLVFCLLWLAVFGILSKRVSTSILGLGLLSLLSNSKLTTLGAAVIFVVGDGIAAVVGVAFGMRKWPWGGGKTVLGSLAFLVSTSIAMGVMLYFTLKPTVQTLFALAFWPSLVGSIAETLPIRFLVDVRDLTPDDNLPVVLSSGALLHFLANLVGVNAPTGS